MATPTAPTVDRAPEEPTAAPAAPTGALASILTPVQPARPVEPIGSTASMAEESMGASTGGGTSAKSSGRGGSVQQEGHWAALVRAVAARIGRTGTANTIKRQHTITETRMSGNQVNTANRINRDTKHSGLNHRDAKINDNQSKIRQSDGRNHHEVKSSDAKASTHNGQSRTGRDVKDHKDTKTTGATTSKQDAVHRTGRDGLDGKPGKGGDAKPTKPAGVQEAAPKAAKPTDSVKNTDATKTGSGETPKAGNKAPAADKTPDLPSRPRTQPSREAGYRDGTRGAAVANHVKAYRDGAKDGFADGTAEYEREKRRMDDAKARNARKPTAPTDMAPVSGSTVELAKKEHAAAPADVVPVTLTGISETAVAFDADGASHTLSRGEVRTLRAFEQRIADKIPVLQQVAEGSKTTRAKAAEHATRALRLAEQAKDVEGGGRLVAKLERLAEAAQALHARTEEIEKAAHRGAEALRVLNANANTRHGGIYRAVADSPLTKPAERNFYQDGGS